MTGRGALRLHPMGIDGPIDSFAPFHNVNCPRGFLYFNRQVGRPHAAQPGSLTLADAAKQDQVLGPQKRCPQWLRMGAPWNGESGGVQRVVGAKAELGRSGLEAVAHKGTPLGNQGPVTALLAWTPALPLRSCVTG